MLLATSMENNKTLDIKDFKIVFKYKYLVNAEYLKNILFENEIRQTDYNSIEIIQMKVLNEVKNDYTENNT